MLKMLLSSSRLEPLTKMINFQECAETKKGIPTLIFNAQGTHGRYKHNKGIRKAINNVIIYFVTTNLTKKAQQKKLLFFCKTFFVNVSSFFC